jgi:hypothetical protein
VRLEILVDLGKVVEKPGQEAVSLVVVGCPIADPTVELRLQRRDVEAGVLLGDTLTAPHQDGALKR